jgi:hypothetical protein
MATIRELKRAYKVNLALGETLPPHDLAIPLPLSTGRPLFDAALTDKLVATQTLNEAEHVGRAWHLVRGASAEERAVLGQHARGLLNDYRLLLALRCWELGDEAGARPFLRSLPWGWRLGFPTAVIKPAAQVFTGWRRSLRFRLVEEPRFDALKAEYRETLAHAPPVALLKYRATVHQATALLHYRPEGERERAIHDWCYGDGSAAEGIPELEPLPTYVRARRALRAGGVKAMLDVLEASPALIPITSYMGLLGGHGIRLTDDDQTSVKRLRDYAVRCATAVECLLRLKEWSPWLKKRHIAELSTRVRETIVDEGRDIPFFKVVKAFLAAPIETRKRVVEPLLVPLMRHFGERTAALLPPPGPITYLQPGNVLHVMSFLLYACLASAVDTRLLLLYKKGLEQVEPIPLERLAPHLADDAWELQEWLLEEFGGLSTRYEFTYDMPRVARTLRGLDPEAPLVLDLPFAQDPAILEALLPFERVLNLNSPFGAPGELCLATSYYSELLFATRGWSFGVWGRYSDSAAMRFAELLDRLGQFQALSAALPGRSAE